MCYSCQNDINHVHYIPEDIYYGIIEKLKNNYELAKAYTDKNFYRKLFDYIKTPQTALRIINGRLYNEAYQPIQPGYFEHLLDTDQRYVFKPAIESGGGAGIYIESAPKIIKRIHDAMSLHANKRHVNFIVQEYLAQHPSLEKLHPHSLNTLRIMTLRLDDEIHHVSSVMRMGVNKKTVDNQSSGGISCGIDQNGTLKKYAFDKMFNRYEQHPNTEITFLNFNVPMYDQAVEMCREIHDRLCHFDIISWDIAISAEGELHLIEFNVSGQEINFHQLNNGPLFGTLTERLLKTLSMS